MIECKIIMEPWKALGPLDGIDRAALTLVYEDLKLQMILKEEHQSLIDNGFFLIREDGNYETKALTLKSMEGFEYGYNMGTVRMDFEYDSVSISLVITFFKADYDQLVKSLPEGF